MYLTFELSERYCFARLTKMFNAAGKTFSGFSARQQLNPQENSK